LAVKIRLKRIGRKKVPFYRIIVIDRPDPRDGAEIEDLGRYNPLTEPVLFDFKEERVKYWLSVGAQPSDTVRRILGVKGLLPKVEKTPKNPGVSRKDKKAQAASTAK
jgi:small subunit ribosomal protein S16